MSDLNALTSILTGGGSGSVGATKDLEARAQQGQLSFAASIFAMKSGCACGACQLLRRAMDAMTGDTLKEFGLNADSANPVP